MLKQLADLNKYMDFIHEINGDPNFSDPMLSSSEQIRCNLLDAPNRPDHHIWGIFEGEAITGLFVFLVLAEESYIEMIVGLSRTPSAYHEVLTYLKENYSGYQADFVYNPGNYLLHRALQEETAEFDPEQQKMVLEREVPYQSTRQVELYRPEYREQYISIHSKKGYWTAEKVIDAPDRFRILLALEGDEVVGYLDITHKFEENEPFDLFVKEAYRRKGCGRAMLARAIALNRPKGLMALVDADNAAVIALYQSLGFVKAVGANNITAHVVLHR